MSSCISPRKVQALSGSVDVGGDFLRCVGTERGAKSAMASTREGETPEGYSKQFQAVVNMLPVGVYTVWSTVGIYVTGSSGKSPSQPPPPPL
jgi:hypothetical protein